MNRSEIAVLLGLAAARDQRTVGDADVLAWHEDIGDLDLADAREALTRHFRESTDRIMPAHIRRLVKVIREERGRQTPHEVRALPSRFEQDVTRDIRIKSGLSQCHEILEVIAAKLTAQRSPDGELTRSEEIHQRALRRAAAERRLTRPSSH